MIPAVVGRLVNAASVLLTDHLGSQGETFSLINFSRSVENNRAIILPKEWVPTPKLVFTGWLLALGPSDPTNREKYILIAAHCDKTNGYLNDPSKASRLACLGKISNWLFFYA